jgi:hypothetical protein
VAATTTRPPAPPPTPPTAPPVASTGGDMRLTR